MAESISPERMQRLMELSNNAMTVELGALRNPQVTTVPSNEANAFYQSAPYAEREINKYLYEQYRKIREAKDKFARGDLSKYRFEEAIREAKYNINQMKPSVENGLDQAGLDYLDQKQQEGISSLKDTVSTEFNPDFSMPELDQSRDQIVLGEKMNESVLAHEIGHAAFSVAKDFFRSKVVELGSIEDALKATALEYGRNIADKIEAGVRGNLDGLFADTDEATVQYYDNPLGDDPSNPGVGTPTSEGGPTYYSPGGGFDADTDNTFSFLPSDRANTTDPLLQKPFTDYRTGELVYHDEYKGDFEGDLKEAGLMGFETLMSDLISERKGLDRFAERQRRGLKINPLGAPKGEVLRSVRPQTRPEKFAQGGPVMRGIGTLNETARNMFRGPRGIGAYQQFAYGGPVTESGVFSTSFSGQMDSPFGQMDSPFDPERYTGALPLSGLQPYPFDQPLSGQMDNGFLGKYRDYLGQKYGAEDAAIEASEQGQKIDGFIQSLRQQEQETFGGSPSMSATRPSSYPSSYAFDQLGRLSGNSIYDTSLGKQGPMGPPQGLQSLGVADMPFLSKNSDLKKQFMPALFANGGPVYMNNGGEGGVESIKDGVLQTVFDVESNGDFNRWHDDAQNIPETPLTQMTVSEIMGYQGGENGPAAGAGQIKYNTFQYLLNTGTLKPDEVFSPQVQRKAHFRLLDRRGFNEWVQGELSNDGFIQRLAREYAAVPLAQDEQVGDTLRESGKSRYGGSNAHRISLDNMRNVLTSLKSPSMASEAALDEAMYAADYLEPQTMPLFAEPEEAGPDLIDAQTFDFGVGSMMPPTTGEELRQGFRPSFGSQSQQDDFEARVPQKISMRDKYSTENIAADLVGGKEALEEGIGGLTESLRPKLRPSEIEFGEDKGGVFRSLMPPRRKQKEYPRNDPDALFRGLGKIRGRTLRKGFTPYVQDVRGELT